IEHWGYDEKQLKALKSIAWPQGYANMSHKAMSKMIPWLRQGVIFSHAAFLANIDEAFGEGWMTMTNTQREKVVGDVQAIIESMRVEKGRAELINGLVKQYRRHWDETKNPHGFWSDVRRNEFDRAFNNWSQRELGDQLSESEREALRTELVRKFDAHIDEFGVKAPFIKLERADERIANYLCKEWDLGFDAIGKLYHPADIEIYPEARGDLMGSPFHPALNNPVALRALHALRFLINALLKSGAVDKDTRIRIELARELNSANERRAWQWFQNDMFERRRKAEEECKKWFDQHMPGTPITEDAIQRVWLMQESEEVLGQAKCVYTNRALSMADVLGGTANTDVEHTWPKWRSLDDSMANKMLCDREYNRQVKRDSIPAECENWDTPRVYKGAEPSAILPNVEKFREKMEHYEMLVKIRKQDSKQAQDPGAKNSAIVQKNYYNYWYRYWKTKYEHFALESIPLGFTNRQQVEVGMITRYARAYLRTYFPRVDCVKGELVSFLRKEWMGQKQEQKDRTNHFHHLVDAVTLAATNKETTDRVAHELRQQEERNSTMTPTKPWPSFAEDVKRLKDRILVYHYNTDPLGRTSRYRVKGRKSAATGSTVRGSLHKDTFYGRILWKDPQT
ncbi:MAG TPA: HNH endonuclease domain-containing protein, partial [Flavobacteriales bacterium]|nr:HNH endonuclease domain-containing protein [Flavobacteriales bacterium]